MRRPFSTSGLDSLPVSAAVSGYRSWTTATSGTPKRRATRYAASPGEGRVGLAEDDVRPAGGEAPERREHDVRQVVGRPGRQSAAGERGRGYADDLDAVPCLPPRTGAARRACDDGHGVRPGQPLAQLGQELRRRLGARPVVLVQHEKPFHVLNPRGFAHGGQRTRERRGPHCGARSRLGLGRRDRPRLVGLLLPARPEDGRAVHPDRRAHLLRGGQELRRARQPVRPRPQLGRARPGLPRAGQPRVGDLHPRPRRVRRGQGHQLARRCRSRRSRPTCSPGASSRSRSPWRRPRSPSRSRRCSTQGRS